MNDLPFLTVFKDHCRLKIYAQPGAKKTQIAGLFGEALKIRLAAPPVDGKANSALIAYLANAFHIAPSLICLKSGEQSRHKLLVITSSETERIQMICQGFLAQSRERARFFKTPL